MIRIEKALFLHIPKTGGTWVTRYFQESGMVLEQTQLAHINCSYIDEWPEHHVIFCFVRHPLTWYRSYWQCKQTVVKDRRGGPIDEIVDMPFSDFIDCVVHDLPGYFADFVAGFTSHAHFIGKQETLRKDLNRFLTYLRIPYDKTLLFDRETTNVIPSKQKYTMQQAKVLLKSEQEMVTKYDYNYIPMEVIE